MRCRGSAGLLALGFSLTPGLATAGGTEVDALALAALVQTETLGVGSLVGPPSSRATWFSLGGIRPFHGEAMAVFSTGLAGMALLPGTDLSAVGVDDDIVGMNFPLTVPEGARSLRFAYRVIAPAASVSDPAAVQDRARVEVIGDPIALDPWILADLSPSSAAVVPDSDGLLDGTGYEGGWLSDWLVAVVPVQPLSQISVLFTVRDGGTSPLGDYVMLLDGISFDEAVPLDVPPGVVPDMTGLLPSRVPDGQPSTVVVQGNELPEDLAVSLIGADGLQFLDLGPSNVLWLSGERVQVQIPALEPGVFGVRLLWGDGASLTWPAVLRIGTPAPSIDSVRPDVSPQSGGGLAVLEGSGFYGVSSVRVAGLEVPDYRVLSPDRIEFVVPAGDPGPRRLLVIAAGGSDEIPQGILYSAPVSDPDASDPGAPAGPTVLACGVATGPHWGWLALLGLLAVRRGRGGRDVR